MELYILEPGFKDSPDWRLRRPTELMVMIVLSLGGLLMLYLLSEDPESSALVKVSVATSTVLVYAFGWWTYFRYIPAIRLNDTCIAFWRNQRWTSFQLAEFSRLSAFKLWGMRGMIWIVLHPVKGSKQKRVHYFSWSVIGVHESLELLAQLRNDFRAKVEARQNVNEP